MFQKAKHTVQCRKDTEMFKKINLIAQWGFALVIGGGFVAYITYAVIQFLSEFVK